VIRRASIADVKEFFSERGLACPDALSVSCIVVDELMLIAYIPLSVDDCEVHICVKKRGLRHINELINAGIAYLQKQGFSRMATAIEPKYTTAIKLVERLGFAFVECYNDRNIYMRVL
jgi:hypothetical protein